MVDMNTAAILWGVLFSSIGIGLFIYGKKQQAMVPRVCGLILMIYPFFISSTLLTVIIGAVFTAIPYFIRR
jgi:predicted membrane protein